MALPTAISFFSGFAGIDLGLRRVIPSIRTICYVEREAYAAANLVAKIKAGLLDDAPIWSDITTFDYAGWRGLVDIAHGGAPCQPHSCTGKRKGGGDERFLFDIWIDGLGIMQPGLIFIENVEGLLTSRMPGGTLCIRHVLRRLEDIGYCVEDDQGKPLVGIFSASEVGAPHRRKRVFILAEFTSKRSRKARKLRFERSTDRASGCSQTMADTGQRLLLVSERRPEGRTGVGPNVENLADAKTERHPQWISQSGNDGEKLQTVDRSGNQLGNAESDEQRRHSMPGEDRERQPTGRPSLPEFPPGPGNPAAWREVLEIDPTLEPALCRLAHGRPFRVDELRLAGNGVVPATAAKAFRVLLKRML